MTDNGEKTSGLESQTDGEIEIDSSEHNKILVVLLLMLLMFYGYKYWWMYSNSASTTTINTLITMSFIIFTFSYCLLISSNPRTIRFGFIGVCIATFINMVIIPIYGRLTYIQSEQEKELISNVNTKIVLFMDLCLLGLIPLCLSARLYTKYGNDCQ